MELIERIVEAKSGDDEFILGNGLTGWFAAIGNKSEHVPIGESLAYGESNVDFYAEGLTPSEALTNLLTKLTT